MKGGQNGLTDRIYQNRTQIIIIAVILFLLELQIFAVAVSSSGNKYTLQVLNEQGTVFYETDGQDLTEFKKYYFEETFGPFENYRKRLVTTRVPFPFRGWFSAAVGVPVGFILLFSFAIRTYKALFFREDDTESRDASPDKGRISGFDRFMGRISRLNIFVIGAIVFLSVFSYWVIPNFLTHIGQTGMEVIDRYKWFFAAVGVSMLLLVSWNVYLRYLLAKKSIETEAEVRKFQIQIGYDPAGNGEPLQLAGGAKNDTIEGTIVEE